ncbi:hypothetical protein [Halobacterium noricense]|uniref:hypothetical protein n=1 Tax=Halobacterium noricense TaxID=223182 RepID=UPI001E5C384A|nr:hypothetical protein [Halobacterium noricense]UHH24719.1 hypothetical protein LT974_12110 [Halobacterium noricense]
MADRSSEAVETTLEGPVASWLSERADGLGVPTEVFLERVLAAYREADEQTDVVTSDDLDDRLASVEDDLRADVEAVDSEFDEKIQDVRERVIQVKRDADAKAPKDHDHPALSSKAEEAVNAARDAQAEVAEVSEAARRLRGRVDAGFDNFEEVLTYLRDETQALDRKTTTLATAVVSMRDSVASLAAAEARRERAERLKREANVAGVREAECGECGEQVSVALLTTPECPFCAATIEEVKANPGWFGAHVLVTGSAPALPTDESVLDDESWLGTDGETLEAMASGDDGEADDGPKVVDPEPVDDDELADTFEVFESAGVPNDEAEGGRDE